jgi:hypothetical protein
MDPLHHNTDDEDDIHTINSLSYQSHYDRPSLGSSSGMMQASSESFRVNHDRTTQGIPAAFDHQQQQLPTQTSSPDVVYSNPDVGRTHSNVMEDESDDQTTTTMEYPMSLNSFYSHRDALSASGSYGADMSFVTTQTTSIASPPPAPPSHEQVPQLRLQQLKEQQILEQPLPRLCLHEVSDGELTHELSRPTEYHSCHLESTQSAIKAAMERGTNMAYDESASVIGLSTVAHTIASSSIMTKENNKYFFNSAFLRSQNYVEAEAIVVEEDRRPEELPHPPSLPYKGTDLTSDSMFLGMDYDNDYIKTKIKGDSTTTAYPVTKSSVEIEETIRRIHRKRILCCVYILIVLILIVGIGGIMCTFGTTCPGVEKLSSRSKSSASTEDKYYGTSTMAPTPTTLIRNSPTADSNVAPTSLSAYTDNPVISKTYPPTRIPMAAVAPPMIVVVKESKSPTTSPIAPPSESGNTTGPPSPTNDSNNVDNGNSPSAAPSDNTGNAPNSVNEPNKVPTAAPTKKPSNVVTENSNDVPTASPTDEPTASSPNDDGPTGTNDDRLMADDAIPTISPTFGNNFNDDGSRNDDTTNDDRSTSTRSP